MLPEIHQTTDLKLPFATPGVRAFTELQVKPVLPVFGHIHPSGGQKT